MALAAVILDFDGLILDTETPIYEAWQETYRRYGFELEMDQWQHALGTRGGFDPCRHLASLLAGQLDREAVHQGIRERNLVRCGEQPLLPGVVALLEEALALGLKRAVASSSSRTWVEGWLERHQIRSFFAAVCAREDVKQVKPAPDLYLLAARRLEVDPGQCVVFEDSPNGMRAARAAGMRVVAVPNALTARLPLPDPDLVLPRLDAEPLAEILRRLEALEPAAFTAP